MAKFERPFSNRLAFLHQNLCEAYNFHYIVGLEFNEDISDLKKQSKIAQDQPIFMRIVHVKVGRNISFVA